MSNLESMKKEWSTMGLEKKRSHILAYWRDRAARPRGIEERKEVLKNIFITQNLEIPELEGYLERMYIKITGGTEC